MRIRQPLMMMCRLVKWHHNIKKVKFKTRKKQALLAYSVSMVVVMSMLYPLSVAKDTCTRPSYACTKFCKALLYNLGVMLRLKTSYNPFSAFTHCSLCKCYIRHFFKNTNFRNLKITLPTTAQLLTLVNVRINFREGSLYGLQDMLWTTHAH